jgi:hypothetical protein
VAPVALFGGAGAERERAEVLTDAAGRYRVALSSGWGGQGGMLSF